MFFQWNPKMTLRTNPETQQVHSDATNNRISYYWQIELKWLVLFLRFFAPFMSFVLYIGRTVLIVTFCKYLLISSKLAFIFLHNKLCIFMEMLGMEIAFNSSCSCKKWKLTLHEKEREHEIELIYFTMPCHDCHAIFLSFFIVYALPTRVIIIKCEEILFKVIYLCEM